MSGLAGDDYNDATEATRGAAAAPMPALDFLSQGLGPSPYAGDGISAPVMGFGAGKPLQKVQSQDSEGSPSKLAQPLMSIGQMSTQDQTPLAKPQQQPTASSFQLPVLQRDGGAWRARKTPVSEKGVADSKFYYAPTHLQFEQSAIPLHEIVSRVFEFAEREFAVEVLASSDASNGTFDLACFVKTAMVIVKVCLWEDSTNFVAEMALVNGDGITFCEIFRRFKRVMDPKGTASADKDALSTQAPLSTAGSVESADKDALMQEEMAMDGEQLLEFGGEFAAPSSDEWESVLADCEVFADPSLKSENEANRIAAAVESLASIACTYAAKDLEYLAECVGERKIGLCHDCYCDQRRNAATGEMQYGVGECHRAGKNVLAQLWAVAALVKHLAKHQGNLVHLQKIVPALDVAIRKLLCDSYEQQRSEVCLHTTVVHALAEALCTVLTNCRDYDVLADAADASVAAFHACGKDANVQALFKQAQQEQTRGHKCVAAAANLRKAYECWGSLCA